MSHFEVNKKNIASIMSSDISDEQKDEILIEIYFSNGFKGGDEMRKKTYEWFIGTYQNQCKGFCCLLYFKNEI